MSLLQCLSPVTLYSRMKRTKPARVFVSPQERGLATAALLMDRGDNGCIVDNHNMSVLGLKNVLDKSVNR